MTGRDSRSARNPSRTVPAITAISPASSARVLASAAYREESRAASGPIAAAVISAVVASGPSDSGRDEPRAA